MSFSGKHRNVRVENGKGFPVDPAGDVAATFAAVIADALRRDFGVSPTKVKHLARLMGTNARTIQNWIYARNGPSAEGLVLLMRHSDAVTMAVLSLAGRHEFADEVRGAKAHREARAAIEVLLAYLSTE